MSIKKVGALSLACLSAASIAVPVVHAQSATTAGDQTSSAASDTLQEVVVSGLRQSLNQAEIIKRFNPQVVDSIVAQDIGKFPDTTVGDALQRVPGVQVTRNNDQVVGVNIRGLPNVETTLERRRDLHHQSAHVRFSEHAGGGPGGGGCLQDELRGSDRGRHRRPHRRADPQALRFRRLRGGRLRDRSVRLDRRLAEPRGQCPGERPLADGSRRIRRAGQRVLHPRDYDYPIVWEDTPHNPEPTSQTGLSVPAVRAVHGLGVDHRGAQVPRSQPRVSIQAE